jgi:S-formylglutathione hydrolase FrmB
VNKLGWLGALLLLWLPLPRATATGWKKEPTQDLKIVNRRISGEVIDYTNNHGHDNRIFSKALFQRRDLYVYLPPRFDPNETYPLLIWMHGFDQDEQSFLKEVVKHIDRAIRTGKLPPLIVAAPDGSLLGEPKLGQAGSFFLNSQAGDFGDYLLQDVWDFMCHHYPIRSEREAHILAGVSMGGFAAFHHAIAHRECIGVAVGIYPPLNLRWMDCHGNYRANFNPKNWGWRTELDRSHEIIGVFALGLVKVRISQFLDPLLGIGPDAIHTLSCINPIEMIDRTHLSPGELDMYVAYAGHDQFNIDAQVESFLYLAKHRGLDVGVGYKPHGMHGYLTAVKLFPGIVEWLAPKIAPFAPEKLKNCPPPAEPWGDEADYCDEK